MTLENKTILPDEIKIWIEDEIKNASHVFSIEQICTSLYQHLQENGRVAELEKEVKWLNEQNFRLRKYLSEYDKDYAKKHGIV